MPGTWGNEGWEKSRARELHPAETSLFSSSRAWRGLQLLRGVMVTQLILVQLFKVRVLAG